LGDLFVLDQPAELNEPVAQAGGQKVLPIVSMSRAQLTVQDAIATVDEAGWVAERGRLA
jgi:hypothetical protein